MMPFTRRRFLSASSALLAGLGIATPHAQGMSHAIRHRRGRPADWLPAAPSEESLRALALVAMEAARSAGAEFADIRIGFQRSIGVPVFPYTPSASLVFGYGVRARVRNTWSFASGTIMTRDAVASVARSAAVGAKQYAAINASLKPSDDLVYDLAPAPAVNGRWSVTWEIDPFEVPIDDYYRTIGMLAGNSPRVVDGAVVDCVGLGWRSELRIFASTDGSLVTQTFLRGGPSISATACLPSYNAKRVSDSICGLESTTAAGFEVALRTDLPERMRTLRDSVARWAELPRGTFNDVGRYPIVFSGAAWAGVVGATAIRALDGDMAMGLERDASGNTFLRPPADVLGASAPLFSPLLTVESDRTQSPIAAAKWDDDGVAPEPYTLIDRGHITDYHTTRETAPILTEWYKRHGTPLRSHGCSIAETPLVNPVGGFGHARVLPATQRASIDDLLRDIRQGFYIVQGTTDDASNFAAGRSGGQLIVEIKNGKPVASAVIEAQIVTKLALGAKLVALGDAGTVQTAEISAMKGVPWRGVSAPVTAPAALCADVPVKGFFH